MKPAITLLLPLLLCTAACAQVNLDFESVLPSGLPDGWYGPFNSTGGKGFQAKLDSSVKFEGKRSLSLSVVGGAPGAEFGAFSQTITANYSGQRIRLTGRMRTQAVDVKGWAGLWLRLDGASGILGFDNMMAKKVIGTNDWKEYEINVPYDEDTEKIVIGGLLVGSKGKIWVDDMTVTIDGLELANAKPKTGNTYPARLDTGFTKGSGIKFGALTKVSIANLKLLGQVWGFLKYYHPTIAKGEKNWDLELLRFLPAYYRAAPSGARDKLLVEWIEKLGPVPRCAECTDSIPGELKLRPDLDWMKAADLGPDLKAKLEEVRKNRNQGKHYYVSIFEGVGNPKFQNELAYEQFSYPDDGYRLLALYRFWNMVQYFFPYRYAIGENWNAVLEEFVPKLLAANGSLQYRLVALELIGRIHDTHANLWMMDGDLRNYKGKMMAPVQVRFIGGKLVVTDFYDVSRKPAGLTIGDVIIEVGGEPVGKMVQSRLKYYPASNYPTQLRDIAREILRTNNEKIEVKVEKGNKTEKVTLGTMPIQNVDTDIDWGHTPPDSCYRLLSENVGYIYLGNIKTSLLPEIFRRFAKTKGIVIDLRNYPSEFMVFTLSEYIQPSPKSFVKFTSGSLTYPGAFTYTTGPLVGKTNPEYYRGKIVVLINEMSQSQSEYTTMAFRSAPNVTVIGSTTAGADGDISRITLPGGLQTAFSGLGVYYPDGRETQRVGIIPDIEVNPTIKGIREGRDEVLDKAIEIINR